MESRELASPASTLPPVPGDSCCPPGPGAAAVGLWQVLVQLQPRPRALQPRGIGCSGHGGGHHPCQTDRAAAPAPSSPAQAPSASQGHLRPTVAPTLRTSKDPAPLNPSRNAEWRALVPALNPTPPPPRVPRLPVTPACLSPLGFVLMPQQGPATGPGAGKQDPALPQLGSPVSFLVPFFRFDAFFFHGLHRGFFEVVLQLWGWCLILL